MDEKPDQILGHIEAQRDQLGRNLNELETRVRENADWRTWFDRNPMMVMGAALGGGLLVGSMLAGKTSGRRQKSRKNNKSYRMTGDIIGSGSSSYGSSDMGASTIGSSTAGVGPASAGYAAGSGSSSEDYGSQIGRAHV